MQDILYMVKRFLEKEKEVVAMREQTRSIDAGCYSVKYRDPHDGYWQFSMDYDWRVDDDPQRKNQWTCAESPTGVPHWTSVQVIPDHAFHALLQHFGLEEGDVSLGQIAAMSPADLVRIRRAKEIHDGLAYMLIMNMRTGCPKGELADTFEARP